MHKLPGMIPIDDVCIEKGFEIMTECWQSIIKDNATQYTV